VHSDMTGLAILYFFNVLLTLHLSIILAIEQLKAQIPVFLISLLYFFTFFEHYLLIIWRSNLYYTASGNVILCRWSSGAHVCKGRPPTGVMIPEAV